MTTNIETKKYFIPDTHLIDFSAPDASKYYASVLTRFRFEKQIDSFLLAAFTLTGAQLKFNSTQYREYPSMYATSYVETAIQAGNVIQSEFAFKTQHLPAFLRLISFEHTPADQLLRELIPTVLSVSIAGYSFVVPYSIGGFDQKVKPTEEIIIRWIQATALMPSMSFAKLPWNYTEQTVTIAKKFVALHSEHAPTIIELAKRRVQNGAPIVRPMWYDTPEDVATYRIGDQFMLGDDIVVAPVVAVAQRERPVYLPTGAWIDQHGKEWVGPREYKIAVPLDELPYFKRKH